MAVLDEVLVAAEELRDGQPLLPAARHVCGGDGERLRRVVGEGDGDDGAVLRRRRQRGEVVLRDHDVAVEVGGAGGRWRHVAPASKQRYSFHQNQISDQIQRTDKLPLQQR